jgi:hypothetical protein
LCIQNGSKRDVSQSQTGRKRKSVKIPPVDAAVPMSGAEHVEDAEWMKIESAANEYESLSSIFAIRRG